MSDPIGAVASRQSARLAVNGPGSNAILDQFLRDRGIELDAAQGLPQHGDTGARQVPVFPADTNGSSFGDSLKQAINSVGDQQDTASNALNAFLRGEPVELHQVMAATEEAQISLQMLIEVRNKFAEAYRTLSNMQG